MFAGRRKNYFLDTKKRYSFRRKVITLVNTAAIIAGLTFPVESAHIDINDFAIDSVKSDFIGN